MSRGDRREPASLDGADRRLFIGTFGETSETSGAQIHAYSLVGKHGTVKSRPAYPERLA